MRRATCRDDGPTVNGRRAVRLSAAVPQRQVEPRRGVAPGRWCRGPRLAGGGGAVVSTPPRGTKRHPLRVDIVTPMYRCSGAGRRVRGRL